MLHNCMFKPNLHIKKEEKRQILPWIVPSPVNSISLLLFLVAVWNLHFEISWHTKYTLYQSTHIISIHPMFQNFLRQFGCAPMAWDHASPISLGSTRYVFHLNAHLLQDGFAYYMFPFRCIGVAVLYLGSFFSAHWLSWLSCCGRQCFPCHPYSRSICFRIL